MSDSESTPRRHLPRGMDKLPPDFHKVDTRPEGARESDEYEENALRSQQAIRSAVFDRRSLHCVRADAHYCRILHHG